MAYQSFEEIPVWQKSHQLTLEVYLIAKTFPKDEMYGLTSQLKRSAASVPANIVEGFYRYSTKELIQYLYISRASGGETIYHLRLALDLKYLSLKDYLHLREEYDGVSKQLNGWIKSLRNKANS